MPTRALISIGCFAASNALLHIQNHRLRKQNAKLSSIMLAESEMILYLSELIDRNELPMTEFDRVAINLIADKVDKS